MTNDDKPRFLRAFAANAAVFNKPVTDDVVGIYWAILADYDVNDVEAAFVKHLKVSKFFPTPAELVALIPSAHAMKHVDADEAWAIVLASMDEAETVVMTQPMLEARGIAWPIWQDGDEIGARMAFRSAYNRIIAAAGKPVWRVVAGWDAERRLSAIEQAKLLGRLPADYRPNQNLLPMPAAETTVSGLLENLERHVERSEEDAKKAKQHVAKIRAMLNQNDFSNGIAERQAKRDEFEQHRQQELAKLAQKSGGLH